MKINRTFQKMIEQGFTTAQKLANSGMSTNALRTNATLRKEEWLHYDTAVIEAAQDRLVGVADVMGMGLVLRIPGGLGKTSMEYEKQGDVSEAQISMTGTARGENDAIEWDLVSMPLPIIHKDWNISIRKLEASRNTGESLDTTQSTLAAGKVAEKVEEILFQGASSYTFGGGTIYGLTDEPDRNTGSLAAHWDDSAASGETILADVLAMIQDSIDAQHFGPFMLYIPTNFETAVSDNYVVNYPRSIRERLLELESLRDMKVADKMPADNTVLVQMTQDVVRMVEGLPLSNVEWDAMGGMVFNFKVMTINVAQVRSNKAGQSGVTNYN